MTNSQVISFSYQIIIGKDTVRKFKEEFLKKQQEAEHVESLGDDYMQTEAEAFAV